MKIKTSTILVGLNNEPIKTDKNEDITLGMAIATIIISQPKSDKYDPLKSYVLSNKFYNEDEVDIDASDLSFVKDAIKATGVYTPLISGQLLLILEQTK